MTHESEREPVRDRIVPDGGDVPTDVAERYEAYRAEARGRWDDDTYDDVGGPLLRLWDAYALAYDDPHAWLGVKSEMSTVVLADGPPASSDGEPDGELPVPTEAVADAIETVEEAYEVRIRRRHDRDRVVDPAANADFDVFDVDLAELANLHVVVSETYD